MSLLKKLFLVAFLLFSVAVNAQKADTVILSESQNIRTVTEETSDKFKVETNRFWSNCFITIGGGAQIFWGDHDKQLKVADRFSPALDIAVGKWFTPGLGLRLMYSGLYLNGATQMGTATHSTGKPVPGKGGMPYWLEYQKINYMHFHGDVLFNLNNLFAGYKEDRFWHISPYAGLGIAIVTEEPDSREITAVLGVLNTFRLSKSLDFNLDVRSFGTNDRFDGEVGDSREEGVLSATVGLTYKFKKRNWDRASKTYVYDDTEVLKLRRMLDDLNNENEALKKALAEGDKNKVKEIIKKIPVSSPLFIAFKINKSNLSKEARVNLGLLAEVIKQSDSDIKFNVTGYADAATGNDSINNRLSESRAKAVFDCLVNEFGVPADRLEIEYKGGVENMYYDDPCLSRAVITKAK